MRLDFPDGEPDTRIPYRLQVAPWFPRGHHGPASAGSRKVIEWTTGVPSSSKSCSLGSTRSQGRRWTEM